jgi:hypothetical protein
MRVPVSRARLSTSRSRRSGVAEAIACAISRTSPRALRHPAVDDPAAIGIEIEEAAAEQCEREDVDRENPRREADAVRPFEREVALVYSSEKR